MQLKKNLSLIGAGLLVVGLGLSIPLHAEETTAPDNTTPKPAEPVEVKVTNVEYHLTPQAGFYFFSSGKTKDRFGDSLPSFNLELTRRTNYSDNKAKEISLSAGWIGKDNSNGHLNIIPISFGISNRFPEKKGKGSLSIGISPQLYLVDMSSKQDNVDDSLSATIGATANIGLSYLDKYFLNAGYTFVPEVNDFNFSGFNVNAGVRF
jgi:hypothetical protein